MSLKPRLTSEPNTWDFLREPMIAPTGFREYDARWKYPEEINLPGMTALGLGLGTQMRRRGIEPVTARVPGSVSASRPTPPDGGARRARTRRRDRRPVRAAQGDGLAEKIDVLGIHAG